MSVQAEYRVAAIPLHLIQVDPEQPRKTFKADDLHSLMSSIRAEGLLQPITVRPAQRDTDDAPCYIIVAGERRFRAVCALEWDAIPAIVKELDHAGWTKAQLLENAARVDLDPVEEARALNRALADGIALHDLAKAIGRQPEYVTWRCEMLNARDEVLHLVATGQLPPASAWYIARLTANGQARILRVLGLKKLDSNAIRALSEQIWAEENQAEMFAETKLSSDQIQAVRTFGRAFEDIATLLTRIEKMHEKNPASVRQAFAAESGLAEAKISTAITSLRRVLQMVRNHDAAQLL